MKVLTPAERLIVAADFRPPPLTQGARRVWVENAVMNLTKQLKGTGVYIKLNSALRAVGHDLISYTHLDGLKVFADLKLNDISETLATDGDFLVDVQPELLTVMCSTGVAGMQALKKVLPHTEILGVTVLTSLTEKDVFEMFGCSIQHAVLRFGQMAVDAGIDGLIASPKEAEMLRSQFGDKLTINTPAIRPVWAIVPGDDQNPERIMTPAKAIKAGADRIIVGRPIVKAERPYDAVMRTIEEIESATVS